MLFTLKFRRKKKKKKKKRSNHRNLQRKANATELKGHSRQKLNLESSKNNFITFALSSSSSPINLN
jgi:hypothetical protein